MIGFFIGFLTIVLALVCLLMVVIVMMQKPKQEGLGAAFGGGAVDSMWGANATNILQKITVWLAVMFFVITMLLAILVGVKQKGKINKEQLTTQPDKPAVEGNNTSVGPTPTTPPPVNPITTDPIQIPPAPKPEGAAPEPGTEAPKPEAATPEPGTEAPKPEAAAPEPGTEAQSPKAGEESDTKEEDASDPAKPTP